MTQRAYGLSIDDIKANLFGFGNKKIRISDETSGIIVPGIKNALGGNIKLDKRAHFFFIYRGRKFSLFRFYNAKKQICIYLILKNNTSKGFILSFTDAPSISGARIFDKIKNIGNFENDLIFALENLRFYSWTAGRFATAIVKQLTNRDPIKYFCRLHVTPPKDKHFNRSSFLD